MLGVAFKSRYFALFIKLIQANGTDSLIFVDDGIEIHLGKRLGDLLFLFVVGSLALLKLPPFAERVGDAPGVLQGVTDLNIADVEIGQGDVGY